MVSVEAIYLFKTLSTRIIMTPALLLRVTFITALSCACVTTSFFAAPLTAHAQEPSAINKRDFDTAFNRLKKDINDQIERKNTIYESTIKRERKELKAVLDRMKRNDKVDIAPYEKEIDDFLADAHARLEKQQFEKSRARIKKTVPKITALPGVGQIKPMAPTWCAKIDEQELGKTTGNAEIVMPRSPRDINRLTLQTAAEFSCALKDYDVVQSWMAAYRQEVGNMLGMSTAENDALFKHIGDSARKYEYTEGIKLKEDLSKSACKVYPVLPATALLEDRVARSLERTLLYCSGGFGSTNYGDHMRFSEFPFWFVDIEGGVKTEVSRVALAHKLLMLHDIYLPDASNPATSKKAFILANNYGVAGVVPVDRKKALAEVDALGLSPQDTWLARIAVMGALQDLEKTRHLILDAAKSDPAFKTVFIDAPQRGYKEHAAHAKEGQAAMELLLALEDALKSDAGDVSGCGEAVYKELGPWVKARAKKDKISDFRDLYFDDYAGSVLLHSLMLCGNRDTANVPMMYELLKDYYYPRTEVQRGPLSSAYQAMLAAYGDYRKAPPKSGFSTKRGGSSSLKLGQIYWNPIMRPELAPPAMTFTIRGTGKVESDKQGVIKKISKSDAGRVRIEFKKEKYKSAIRKCTETGKIDRIDSNGRLVPRYSCRTTGYETLTRTNEAVEMPEWAARGLKPGNLLVYRKSEAKEHKNQPAFAWPYSAYKSKAGKKQVMLLGVAL